MPKLSLPVRLRNADHVATLFKEHLIYDMVLGEYDKRMTWEQQQELIEHLNRLDWEAS